MTQEQNTALFLEIAESIRQRIATGELKPGDRLPSVRALAREWHCTPGTVARAYALLARDALVAAHGGGGTRVAPDALQPGPAGLRWAALVNLADRYLLQALGSGHSAAEAQSALAVAAARWVELQAHAEAQPPQPARAAPRALRFAGSHDLAVESLVNLLAERAPKVTLTTDYVGSLGGLIALAQGRADVAGTHLWDAESDTYNLPFVRRLLPGRHVVLLGLAYRSMGLIVPRGNPQHLRELADLTKPRVRLVNRQPGSGTRVWLDEQLRRLGIRPEKIKGYERAESTHLAVAQAVAAGEATAGLGIQAAAAAYGLDFQPLARERYDLVMTAETWRTAPARALAAAVRSPRFREALAALGGYDSEITGQVARID